MFAATNRATHPLRSSSHTRVGPFTASVRPLPDESMPRFGDSKSYAANGFFSTTESIASVPALTRVDPV